MLSGRDSSFDRPTSSMIPGIIASGVHIWGGYLTTRPNVNIAAPWSRADFDVVRALGAQPIAFCSGLDDPAALHALAAELGVRLCLDDEPGIRSGSGWQGGFIQASGAGLYGNSGVHNVVAPFHILADYPGFDPRTTWSGPTPPDNNPRAWQWQGTHTEFGLSVDSMWLDDSFLGVLDVAQLDDIQATVNAIYWLEQSGYDGPPAPAPPPAHYSYLKDVPATLANILASVNGLATAGVNVDALASALAAHPLTAQLTDNEREQVAIHVIHHLSADTASG